MVYRSGLVALSFVVACGALTNDPDALPAAGGAGPVAGSGGAGATSAGAGAGGAATDPCLDTDGDGLSDLNEGFASTFPSADTDWDMVPNYLDLDSDGDGLSDASEAGDHSPCERGRDTDGDGQPDYVDSDSDGDELSDEDELLAGLDPTSVDTNGDGCDDLVEFAFDECDARNVILFSNCLGGIDGEMTLSVRSDIPPGVSDLDLTVTPLDAASFESDLLVEVSSVTPPDAGVITAGVVEAVDPGASVLLEISFQGDLGRHLYGIALTSVVHGTIAHGMLYWMVGPCAIPK